jgi:OHCU decarboxylase
VRRLTLEQLNVMPEREAMRALLNCCGSKAWAREMTLHRPYYDFTELVQNADRVWRRLSPDDWREAFARHPRIGERAPSTATTGEHRWSESEQSHARRGDAQVLAELATVNAEYEERFGHVFLICATAKSAAEILANARARLQNDSAAELLVAAEQQRLITHLRLRKLLDV